MVLRGGDFAAKLIGKLIMGLGMGRSLALAAGLAAVMGIGLAATADRSAAIGLCNCCDSNLVQSCEKVCTTGKLTSGMCPIVVDYDGLGAGAGGNALNGMSLRDMTLGDSSRQQLEVFRRFLEKGRRDAVASYKKALNQFERHKLAKPDLESADARYREALVNYYHGMRAYLDRVGTKSD